MHIKITNGTKQSEIHLCDQCVHSKFRTHDNGHVERQCNATDNESSRWAIVAGSKVVECSVYMKSGALGLNAMQSIAWSLIKSEDGEITFADQNAMRNPHIYTKKPNLWRRIKRYFQ